MIHIISAYYSITVLQQYNERHCNMDRGIVRIVNCRFRNIIYYVVYDKRLAYLLIKVCHLT